MKAIRALMFILLIISNINGKEDYSINGFIEYLQSIGIYDILQLVKYYFGDDIDISVCEDLPITNSNQCETLVRLYLTNSEYVNIALRYLQDMDFDVNGENEDIEQMFQEIENIIEEMNLEQELKKKVNILLDIFKGHSTPLYNILEDTNKFERYTLKIIDKIIEEDE